RVGAVGETNGATGARVPDRGRELPVCHRSAGRDAAERAPHAALKYRTADAHRNRADRVQIAGEEGREGGANCRRGGARSGQRSHAVILQQEPLESCLVVLEVEGNYTTLAIADEEDLANRRGDPIEHERRHATASLGERPALGLVSAPAVQRC